MWNILEQKSISSSNEMEKGLGWMDVRADGRCSGAATGEVEEGTGTFYPV